MWCLAGHDIHFLVCPLLVTKYTLRFVSLNPSRKQAGDYMQPFEKPGRLTEACDGTR